MTYPGMAETVHNRYWSRGQLPRSCLARGRKVYSSRLGASSRLECVRFLAIPLSRSVPTTSSVPADFCQDALHDRAIRLAPFSLSLRAAAAFEALEDGSPSPPHVGGTLVQKLTHVGFLAATVGLREDLKTVAAMVLNPLWDVEKALVELNMIINEKKALVAVTHDE